MLADDIHKGVTGNGSAYFVGRVASMVEYALLDGKKNISVDLLLKAFNDAREFARENQR